MITKELARRIYNAYQKIEDTEKLIEHIQVEYERDSHKKDEEIPEVPRTRRALELGIPSNFSGSSRTLVGVRYELAIVALEHAMEDAYTELQLLQAEAKTMMWESKTAKPDYLQKLIKDHLDTKQRIAEKMMKWGDSIIIAGPAGSGKTTLVNRLNTRKQYKVVEGITSHEQITDEQNVIYTTQHYTADMEKKISRTDTIFLRVITHKNQQNA